MKKIKILTKYMLNLKVKVCVFVFTIVTLLLMQGCTVQARHFYRVHQGIGPRLVKTENVNYSSWQTYGLTGKLKDVRIDTTIRDVDTHSFLLVGSVNCVYSINGKQRRYYNFKYYYSDGSSEINPVRSSEFRNLPEQTKTYIPDTVTIVNPYGPNTQLQVDNKGNFNGEIVVDSKYYFKDFPSTKSDYGLYHYKTPKKLRITITKPDDFSKIWDKIYAHGEVSFPSFSYVKIEDEKAEKFAKRIMPKQCPITLEFKEQITRRSVSPEITITPLIPTKEQYFDDLRSKLQQEFNNNSTLVEVGMKVCNLYNKRRIRVGYVINKKDILWGGKTKKYNAQSISFLGLVGGKYKIETVHGEYNYFRGFVIPSSSKPMNKTILLIEKGEKIRMQEVREGEGGSMIDSD